MMAVLLSGIQTILFSGTQTMNKVTTPIRDHSIENGQGKITNYHLTAILGAILQKDDIIWTEFA